ncbi:MAG: CopD family protein [Ilumatobacter sp.]
MASARIARVFGLLVFCALAIFPTGPARAHTGFESSTPAMGDLVVDPVGVVTLRFTGAPTAIDDGFSALDGDGTVRMPTSIESPEAGVFDVGFDPPLAGGEIGLRWSVRAADGHVLEGGFAFSVEAQLPTTTIATTTTTTVPSSIDSAPSIETEVADGSTSQDASTAAPTTVIEAAPSDTADAAPAAALDESTAGDAASDTTIDEFLDADSGIAGERRGSLGRGLAVPAAAVIVGGLAMLQWVFRGAASEVRRGVVIVRIATVVLAVGAVLRYSGSVAATGESFATAFLSGTERSMALLVVGAVVVFLTCGTAISGGHRPNTETRSLSAATAEDLATDPSSPSETGARRWRAAYPVPVSVGAALIVASYWFDGHTVTRGPRLVHAAVNTVHVIAGSVWFAGVAMLALIAWSRYRRGASSGLNSLVVRFSSIASIALAAVVVAGATMAIFVLDTMSGLWESPWGRVLLLKSAAVAIAAAMGAYNHFVLRPLIVEHPDDVVAVARVRTSVTVEAMMLGFVLIVTATLVATQT